MKDGGKCEKPSNVYLATCGLFRLTIPNPSAEKLLYKLRKRHQLFGQIVRFGIPALWFTINSSDLKNPVVLRVTGTDIHPHLDRHEELNRLRRLHAIGNPTIVA